MIIHGKGSYYIQIADILRERYKTYGPDVKLPAAIDIQLEFGVGQKTVVKAMRILRQEKVVVFKPSKGYFTPKLKVVE